MDKISVPWPCGDNLRLEPIGFMFLIFFGLMMIVQTVGMILHRTSTFLHIIATTELRWGGERREDQVQDAIQLAKDMVRLKDDEVDDRRGSVVSLPDGSESIRRRQTVKKLARQQTRRPTVAKNLDDAFKQRLARLNTELNRQSATPEDIGEKVIGRSRTRGKSVRAINNLKMKGGKIGGNFDPPPTPALRPRCDSLPDEEVTPAEMTPVTLAEVQQATEMSEEAPRSGVKFQLEGRAPGSMSQEQSQL